MEKPGSLKRASAADRIDALLWFVVPVLLLSTIPIGFVSNDGLGHSREFAAGIWHLNPNHLLFEPLGAWWQNLWMSHGTDRQPVDVLKLLSVLSGALAAGLFRYSVAPRLADSRWAANHATAWLAFSSAFLRLWISDETHMIQMPFVVAMAWTALRYLERPSFGRALTLGAAVGLSALTFISNLILGAALAVALAVWHLWRREVRLAVRSTAAIGIGAVLAGGPIFLAVWLHTQGAPGFFAWLTHYGGSEQPTRVQAAYGLVGSWRGLLESVARALYGTASALVDLSPAVAAVRDRQAPSPGVILGVLAFLAAAAALLYGLATALREPSNPASHGALVLTVAWLVAILGFGIVWNNSDDQFYFQMAPAFGALAARIPGRRGRAAAVFLSLSLAGLLWNLIDVSSRRVLYPRWERMGLLAKEMRGACLIVYPGFDEPEMLLQLSRSADSMPQISVTHLASRYPATEGIRILTDDIERCLDAGRRVVLIDIFDTPPDRNPWKFLRRVGYDRREIERSLERLPLERTSRRLGPFTVVAR
jgi:Dolichyl-phosphate-mannose-protein mannosyltransferase